MQLHNEIKCEKRNDVTILDIRGDITASSESFLNQAYQQANDQGAKKILLRIEPEAYINSGGIAVLIQILAQTKAKNQVIGITGVSAHFNKIFKMVGITKFARIHSTVDEALSTMS